MTECYEVFSYDAYDAPPERTNVFCGEFATLEEADSFAKKLVDKGVSELVRSGLTTQEAAQCYLRTGEIPMVFGPEKSNFSATRYLGFLIKAAGILSSK